jgi:hypothetical protein
MSFREYVLNHNVRSTTGAKYGKTYTAMAKKVKSANYHVQSSTQKTKDHKSHFKPGVNTSTLDE